MSVRLIVPGASGFIGRNLVLTAPDDWEVVALYHTRLDFPAWVEEMGLGHVSALRCDLSDDAAVRELCDRVGSRFDACVFLAANGNPAYSVEHPIADLEANVVTLVRFLSHFEIDKLGEATAP